MSDLHEETKGKRARRLVVCVVLFGVVVAGAGFVSMIRRGFSARDAPSSLEVTLARAMRRLAVPPGTRDLVNPVLAGEETLTDARAHFADHCAICHANDGSGDTQIGRNLYPKAPDMRDKTTRSLTDGELFYIIRNGIRLTGMPAWGDDDPAQDRRSWELVHFIRHLPDLTTEELDEMRRLNPKSADEREEEEAARRFLLGEDAPGHDARDSQKGGR